MSLPYNVRDIELLREQRPQPATVLDSGVVMKSKLTWSLEMAVAMKRMKKTSHSLMKTILVKRMIMLTTIRTLKKRLPGVP